MQRDRHTSQYKNKKTGRLYKEGEKLSLECQSQIFIEKWEIQIITIQIQKYKRMIHDNMIKVNCYFSIKLIDIIIDE